MQVVKEGDFVKHKTIGWMNGGKPFLVIKVENNKAFCAYTGHNSVEYFHEFDIQQLIIVDTPHN